MENASNDTPRQVYLPLSVKNKINENKSLSHNDLSENDYLHIYLKNDPEATITSMRFFRSICIFFLNDEAVKEKWANEGKTLAGHGVTQYKKALEDIHTEEVAKKIFPSSKNNEVAPNPLQAQLALTAKLQTELQKTENVKILREIFPDLNLSTLKLSQLENLKVLVDQAPPANDPNYKLFIKVIKHESQQKIPLDPGKAAKMCQGFQKLRTFSEEIGNLVFIASNWKGLLTKGEIIDDQSIKDLQTHLQKEGWASCLQQLENRVSAENKETFHSVLSYLLEENERKGKGHFDREGNREKAIMGLIAGSEEFPELVNQLLQRDHLKKWLEDRKSSVDKNPQSAVDLAALLRNHTNEIKALNLVEAIQNIKNAFDPSVHELINAYSANISNLSEIATPELLMTSLLKSQVREPFAKEFQQFLPNNPKDFSEKFVSNLVTMAQQGHELITEHQYSPQEVAKECSEIFKAQQQKKQQLNAAENSEALNNLLLPKLSPQANWQVAVKAKSEDKSDLGSSLTKALTATLENSPLLQPRNEKEVNAIVELIEVGIDIQKDFRHYSPESIVKGFVDYLTEQRNNHQSLSVPIFFASNAVMPYCNRHLQAMPGWDKDLLNNVSEDHKAFCLALTKEIQKRSDLSGPVNNKELKGMEEMVQAGMEILKESSGTYSAKCVAKACADYLKQMRDDKKSFEELINTFGISSNISNEDLYPLCFSNLVKDLVKDSVGDSPDRDQIATLLANTIKDLSTPLTPEGKEILKVLIEGITSKEFAQGKGIHHVAVAAKLPAMLSDLRLSSVAQLNNSKIPSNRLKSLFNYIQHDEFDNIPNINEIIEEIRERPKQSLQTLARKATETLMGAGHEALKQTSENMDTLISNLITENFSDSMESIQYQLNRLTHALSVTESANVNISISTQGITETLKNEVQQIQIPFKHYKKIYRSLERVQNYLAEDENVKKYLAIRATRPYQPTETEKAEYEMLSNHPSIVRYEYFLHLKTKALNTSNKEARKELLKEIVQFIETPLGEQPATEVSKGHSLLSKIPLPKLSKKQPVSEINIDQDLKILSEESDKAQVLNVNHLDNFGLMGTVIKQGIEGLVKIQEKRNEGTYKDEDLLREIDQKIKMFDTSNKGIVKKVLIGTMTKMATKALGSSFVIKHALNIGMKFAIRKAEQSLANAEVKNNAEKIEKYKNQIRLFKSLQENRKALAEIIVPIFNELQNNHKLENHQEIFTTLKAIIENPNYVLNEEKALLLAGQMAESAEVFLSEFQKNYPDFFENLTEAILFLPNQTKESAPTHTQPLTIWSTEQKSVSVQEKQASERSQKAITALLEKEYKPGKMRDLGNAIKDELENHPFLVKNFDNKQLGELHSLIEEAGEFQSKNPVSKEVLAIACRLYIEDELKTKGKLDIPTSFVTMMARGEFPEKKLAQYCFSATIEQTIRQSKLDYANDPYFISSVTDLISQEIAPSETPLTAIGQENLRRLTAVVIDPVFASGKPLVLPAVQAQFKNMFPNTPDDVETLNKSKIPEAELTLFLERSAQLVKRKIHVGQLQKKLTTQPAKVVTLLTHPIIDNFAEDKASAKGMKQAVDTLTTELDKSKLLDPVKEKVNNFLQKAGILNAVQIEVSLSTRQVTSQIRKDNEALKTYMKKEKKLPEATIPQNVEPAQEAEKISEAQSIGLTTPLVCKVVSALSRMKDVQNKGTAGTLAERQDLKFLSVLHDGLKIARPILNHIHRFPGVIKTLVEIGLKWKVYELESKTTRTAEEEQELQMYSLLLKSKNFELLSTIITGIIVPVTQRHDFTKYEPLIDLLIKISDPKNKDGVNEIALAEAILDATNVFLEEIETHYVELIPDLLNILKLIEALPDNAEIAK